MQNEPLRIYVFPAKELEYGEANTVRADGALFACNGMGNNDIDYVNSIGETEKRGIPVVALSPCERENLVVKNEYLEGWTCFYGPKDESTLMSEETRVLAENTYTRLDAAWALSKLKRRMAGKK